MEQAKRPAQEHIHPDHGHRAETLTESRAVKAALGVLDPCCPERRGLVLLSNRDGI